MNNCRGRHIPRNSRWIGISVIILLILFLRLIFLKFPREDPVPVVFHKFLTTRPELMLGNVSNNTTLRLPLSVSDIKRKILEHNTKQTIHNEDTFGPLGEDSVVIVIQVHDRITYLRYLILSLAQAKNISLALLIFSHDFYDEEINYLVQQVDFCKFTQIFYPFSIQTHPFEFPGDDPKDCERSLTKEQALLRKCINALYPDLYGNYREAKFTQTKHHWWWKANIVFEHLEITRNYTGLVGFFEEDNYVAEDFIHILKTMKETCKHLHTQCDILSLGSSGIINYYKYYEHGKEVEIIPWKCGAQNIGMTFNRTTWMDIASCAEQFCKYDDYNWDWSLRHISENCLRYKLQAIVVKAPRAFHIGECGLHHKKNNCESITMFSKVRKVLKYAEGYLFPDHLTLIKTKPSNKTDLGKGYGGWGDKRDHELCISMTVS